MKSHNAFPEESRLMFQDSWTCWWCGQNHIDCLHHIVGRGNNGSVVESSVLNAAPLNNQICHLPHHGLLRTKDMVKALLKQTYKYLMNYGYELTKKDKDFMVKYAEYYE